MKRAKSYQVRVSTDDSSSLVSGDGGGGGGVGIDDGGSSVGRDVRSLSDRPSRRMVSVVTNSKARRSSWFSGRRIRSNNTAVTTSLEEDIISSCHDLGLNNENEKGGNRAAQQQQHPSHQFSTLRELGMHEMEMNRIDEAIDCFTQALEERADGILYYFILKMRLENSEEEKACSVYQKLQPLLKNIHFFPDATIQLLHFFMEQEEWDACIQIGHQIDYHDMGKIYYHHGIILNQQDSLIQCLKHEPSHEIEILALNSLVTKSQQSGKHNQALRYHERRFILLNKKPEKAKALYEQAESFVALGRFDKAEKSLDKGLDLLPRSTNLLQAKANLLLFTNPGADRHQEAQRLFQQAVEITKNPSEKIKILWTLGRIAHKHHNPTRANDFYQQELKVAKHAFGKNDLELSRIYHELARLEEENCNFQKALDYLKSALRVEQHNYQKDERRRKEISSLLKETRKFMGKLYYKSGDFERALGTIKDPQQGV